METYSTDNNGQLRQRRAAALNTITPALNTSTTNGQAYLSAASGTGRSYTVSASLADRHRDVHAEQHERHRDVHLLPGRHGRLLDAGGTW